MDVASTNNTKGGDFEITGVSRSGRVRKKSSKLLDFQSLDDIEPKTPKRTPKSSKRKPKSDEDDSNDDIEEDLSDNISNSQSENDSEEIEGMVADIVDEDEVDEETSPDPKFRPSLYLSEKSNKKRILRDGKVVVGKAFRKDKGQRRSTAYSLWARDIRKSAQFSKNGDMDFGNTARRLGEMWANVPATEKEIWRRRAKRLSMRLKNNAPQAEESVSFIASPDKPSTSAAAAAAATTSTFLNRPTTSRTKKLAQITAEGKSKTATTPTTPVKRTRRETATAAAAAGVSNTPTSSASSTSSKSFDKNSNSEGFNVTGHEPIDVAAHLKLLGDSLSIIGERLKEHEGQIAVSGSLSVLLDSLLCSLGPLMCLTTQIPSFKKRNGLNTDLQATLDNIAYIMPGL